MEPGGAPPQGLSPLAYRELKPGEVYVPYVPPAQSPPEVTAWSVGWGMFWTVVFSFSAAFLGLKVGQVMEAAIPIAVLAVGFAVFRRTHLLENVIVQSIGGASGVVVAGAIFTLPALYIVGVGTTWWEMALAASLGAVLGVFFLIPLRRYFVRDQHGKMPFPEATATTEVLVTGESGGQAAVVLVAASFVGAIYNFLAGTVQLWKEEVQFLWTAAGQKLADRYKLIFNFDAEASILGLGYIIGPRNSFVLCAGSFLAWYVLVPAFWYVGRHIDIPVEPGKTPFDQLGPVGRGGIFGLYVQKIAVGAIAMAGVLSIIRSLRIVAGSFIKGVRDVKSGHGAAGAQVERTDRDLPMGAVLAGIVASLVGIYLFFQFFVGISFGHSLGATAASALFAFLFTTVSALAIALVARNPVSGMTLLTIFVTGTLFLPVGLSGPLGMRVTLLIACIVCTALSTSGGFITDLKAGYWLGATPRKQEIWKIPAVLVASLSTAVAIFLIEKTYPGFKEKIAAPQANLMATMTGGIMSGEPPPYFLYAMGVGLTLVLEFLQVGAMTFALGMYLPMELNTPALVGGIIAHYVRRSSADPEVAKKRWDRGTLIASGLIAGGALIGIVGVFLKQFEGDLWLQAWVPRFLKEVRTGELVSIAAFTLLCVWLYGDSKKAA